MHTVEEIKLRIQDTLSKLDFNKSPKELYEPIAYSIRMGGKRIRPILTLLGCGLFGGNIEDAIYPSIGIELFHNFTLIHDDIMDKAPLRRGKDTVCKKWNTDIAILSGDTMFAIANKYIVRTKADYIPEILEIFNNAAIEVCEGQQLDMNYEREDNISIPQYIMMIKLKTAALIAASLKIGAVTGNAGKNDADLLYKFGECTGIAFQIKDDLLDVYGDSEKFGKTNCGDIQSNKKTFLYLKACELADKTTRDELKYYYSSEFKAQSPELKVQKVTEIFNSLNIKSIISEEIEDYYNKANSCLEQINLDSSLKNELKDFTDKMMNREK
jgi:geranylgeranyl diphosphate synthase, type II